MQVENANFVDTGRACGSRCVNSRRINRAMNLIVGPAAATRATPLMDVR